MVVHLAGFIYGGCDYEGAIPVKLNTADLPCVTNQSVDTPEKKTENVAVSHMYAESIGAMNVLYSVNDDTHMHCNNNNNYNCLTF